MMRIRRLLALTVLSGGLLMAAGAPLTTAKEDNELDALKLQMADDGKIYGKTVPSEKAEMSLG